MDEKNRCECEIFSQLDTSRRYRAHSVLKRILLSELGDGKTRKILDVGCADGTVGKLIGSGQSITGIELNPLLAAKARRLYSGLLEMDLDAKSIPLPDESFDVIVATDVIEHCKNDRMVMSELCRLLKRDGLFVICLPNIAQFIFRFKLLFGRFDYEKAGVMCEGHLHFYTVRSMLKLIKESGFDVDRMYGTGTLYSYLPVWKSFISPQIIFTAKKHE